jgi:hypothetical protein
MVVGPGTMEKQKSAGKLAAYADTRDELADVADSLQRLQDVLRPYLRDEAVDVRTDTLIVTSPLFLLFFLTVETDTVVNNYFLISMLLSLFSCWFTDCCGPRGARGTKRARAATEYAPPQRHRVADEPGEGSSGGG